VGYAAIGEKDSLLWWWTRAAFWEIRVRFLFQPVSMADALTVMPAIVLHNLADKLYETGITRWIESFDFF